MEQPKVKTLIRLLLSCGFTLFSQAFLLCKSIEKYIMLKILCLVVSVKNVVFNFLSVSQLSVL